MARGLVLLSLGAFLSAPAWATAVYTYTGNTFTYAEYPYTTSMNVTASMTLNSAIAPNQTDLSVVSDLVALSMFDGLRTLDMSSTDLISTTATFSTDSTGAITSWAVGFFQAPPGCPSTANCVIQTVSRLNNVSDEGAGVANAFVSANPGQWTLVPEPGTLPLVGGGVAGLVGFRRRKRG